MRAERRLPVKHCCQPIQQCQIIVDPFALMALYSKVSACTAVHALQGLAVWVAAIMRSSAMLLWCGPSCTCGVGPYVHVVSALMYMWCRPSCTCGVGPHVHVVSALMYMWCRPSCTPHVHVVSALMYVWCRPSCTCSVGRHVHVLPAAGIRLKLTELSQKHAHQATICALHICC